MCGEDDGRRVGGNAGVVVSNVGGASDRIEKDGLFCDEVAIVMGGQGWPDLAGHSPDWWRGALCGNGIVAGAEQCDDGNRFDGDGCSAVCMLEP